MALGLSIGNVEMLGYILVIAATVKYGVYHYKSWWRWGGEWKPVKSMKIQDVRLGGDEIVVLVLGIGLVILAAIHETLMARGFTANGYFNSSERNVYLTYTAYLPLELQ